MADFDSNPVVIVIQDSTWLKLTAIARNNIAVTIQQLSWENYVNYGKTNLTGPQYKNRVYDSVAGKFVYWLSTGSPDKTGAQYPGPGVFSTQTSNYCILGDDG